MKKITIIVPCYNEQESLYLFYNEIGKYMENPKYKFGLLFINDGSKDNTLNILKELSYKDDRIGFISFSRNFGKEAAMHAGLTKCKDDDAVIMIDADLQHPPHYINDMIEYWEEGYKLIYTKFKKRVGESPFKKFCAKMFYRLFRKFSNINLEESVKDFQLLDNLVINAYLSLKDNNRFVKGMFAWVGFQKKCIEFDYVPRQAGTSKWSFKKLFKYGFDGINQYSKIMLLFPMLAIYFVVAIIITNIVLFTLTQLEIGQYMDLSFFLQQMQINVYMLLILGLIYGLFYLIYQTRDEVLKRPVYLVEEEQDAKDMNNNE